jgi:hypothetical protein
MAKIQISDGTISSSAPINIKIGQISSSLTISSSSIDIENSYLTLPELVDEPGLPPPGRIALYVSSENSKLYYKNDFGDVYDLSNGNNSVYDDLYKINISSSTTLLPYQRVAFCRNNIQSSVAVILPLASQAQPKEYYFIKADSVTGSIIIYGNSADTINGLSTYELNGPNQSVVLISDGQNWFVF